MFVHGSFYDDHGRVIEVRIVTNRDTDEELEIGTDSLSFCGEEAVEISGQVGNTFDVLLRSHATIRLLTDRFIPGMYVSNARHGVVNILRDGVLLFAGYIEPHTYSQPFVERLDELEINCIDALSSLQYSRYLDVCNEGDYLSAVQGARIRSFAEILGNAVYDMTDDLLIDEHGLLSRPTAHLFFDGSKRLTPESAHGYDLFDGLSVSDLLFLGDEEDDVLEKREVVEAVLRYLDLHLVQEGADFYLFSWETLRNSDTIDFRCILTDSSPEETTAVGTVPILQEYASGADTTISIGEVYNRLELTADVKRTEELIESPLESGSLHDVCRRYQHYMTEYWSDALREFLTMVKGNAVHREGTGWTDWFIRLKSHSNWVFPGPDHDESEDWHAPYHEGLQQHLIADLLTEPVCKGCLLSIGKLRNDSLEYAQDGTPKSSISFTDYLCIGVNGADLPASVSMDSEQHADELGARFLRCSPVAVYHGNKSGGVFSPVDDETTNYIVITGRMVLNPYMPMSGTVEQIRTSSSNPFISVPVHGRDGGRYLTRMYMKPSRSGEWDSYDQTRQDEWYPFTDEGVQLYEYKWSQVGDSTDQIQKVGVLACMLIIGDKCLVETRPSGNIQDFEWRHFKERDECADDDEYYAQTFSIGFDPKIGDKIIGVSYPIGNNISYKMGLDVEGMAIPIRRSDHLNGKVTFKILGPYNALWNDITRRHGSFWRRTKWYQNSKVLMGYVSSILIDNFEMKIYSDNGFVSADEDNDLVYVSDTDETFVNKKDDLSFLLTSALTSEESAALQVANTVNISTPVNTGTSEGVLEIYDANRAVSAKPEQLYVDAYYAEYHVPRILLTQQLEDTGSIVSRFNRYTHPALNGKVLYIQNIIRDLQAGTAELTLKER